MNLKVSPRCPRCSCPLLDEALDPDLQDEVKCGNCTYVFLAWEGLVADASEPAAAILEQRRGQARRRDSD